MGETNQLQVTNTLNLKSLTQQLDDPEVFQK